MKAALPPTLKALAATHCSSPDQFFDAAVKPLDQQVVLALSHYTTDQANSDEWRDYRVGRVTASKAHTVFTKVKHDGEISSRNTALLKEIMNYLPPAHSPAIDWGNYNERYAVNNFEKLIRRKHKTMKIVPCGLILYGQLPIMAASPDGLVTCKCCGTRPLEVKNPFKHRALSIPKFAEQPDSCLQVTTGKVCCYLFLL